MQKLTIVAKFVAHTEHAERVEQVLASLVEPTLSEDGCERYELNRSVEDAKVFLFYEVWTTRSAWEAHLEAPHLIAGRQSLEGLVADRELLQLTRI